MTIREIEQRSGLERTNIRFYEREGLLEPERRENGYRDYSEADLQLLMKIKLLRRLGFSLDAIRALKAGDSDLEQALAQRLEGIQAQRRELDATEQVCREMCRDAAAFPTLDAQRYLRSYDQALHLPQGVRPSVPDSDRLPPVRCPWRRFFARGLDLSLVALLSVAVLALLFRVNISRIPRLVHWLLGLLEWGIWIPVEGVLLSRFGATPGKWLLGIRVEHANGRRLTFSEAADRAWRVLGRGEGYTIPFYSIYRNWKSYKAVMEGDGPEWDEDVTLVVRENSWWRPVAYCAAVLACALLTLAAAFAPAMPVHRGSGLTVEEFVENYNQLAEFYGVDTRPLRTDGTFQAEDSLAMFDWEDAADVEPLALRFTVEDGVLTGVSYERTYPMYLSSDSAGKRAIQLSAMAFAWADGGMVESLRSLSTIDRFVAHTNGTLEEDLLSCRMTYTITPLGEGVPGSDVFFSEGYTASFSIRRIT